MCNRDVPEVVDSITQIGLDSIHVYVIPLPGDRVGGPVTIG